MKTPPATAIMNRSVYAPRGGRRRKDADIDDRALGVKAGDRKPDIQREQAHDKGGNGNREQNDAPAQQPRAEARPTAMPGDREKREIDGHDQLRERHEVFTSGGSSDMMAAPSSRRRPPWAGVGGYRSRDRGAARRWMRQCSGLMRRFGAASAVFGISRLVPQQAVARSSSARRIERMAPVPRCQSADHGSKQDGDKRRSFVNRIAGRQFLGRQMIRQNAVFDRTEQRRNDTEQEECDEEDQQRVRRQTDYGNRRGTNSGLIRCATALVEPVGDLARQPGGEKERGDEDGAGLRRRQGFRSRSDHLEEDQEHEGVLEKVVVECGEELGPGEGGAKRR
ncbi:MAG: hypothetical protein R3D62_16945 [Xanthobacteraceae bacterium]